MRNDRGLSQEALAELCGLNRNYVGMLERQENSPTVDVLEKLAKALKVDPADILRA
jgi:transcriptional regulator with XRE-family HTH domain